MQITNKHNLPISVAVWLANDTYDRIPDPNYFSATELLKPIKSVILGRRKPIVGGSVVPELPDVSDIVASKIGSAIHDSIEMSWTGTHLSSVLELLGVEQDVIARIVINPHLQPDVPLAADAIPVYLEKRTFKKINGVTIGGKFDFLFDGKLEDFKSTKVYSYIKGSNTDDYKKQASLYRWLNPDIITEELFGITYIFTDWLQSKTLQDPNYPQSQIIAKDYQLMSPQDTEQFIIDRTTILKRLMDAPEEQIPRCTDEELWRTDPVYKYFKNPLKLNRSTKNFDNITDAQIKAAEDGNVGIIQEHKGQVKRCGYCPAFAVCKQKDEYFPS